MARPGRLCPAWGFPLLIERYKMIRTETDFAAADKNKKVALEVVEHEGETFFRISNHDAMRPFFMSVVSDANHWMFISSNGGLTAGRKNPEYALFPYYTDDKITESADTTGSKTIFQVHAGGDVLVWEPFSERQTGRYAISRNLCKSVFGNKILFEEVNHDLGLTFRYQWNSGKVYGFIRKAELINTSAGDCRITLLDGIQNVMPYGVASDLQRNTSNLVDAYKRTELEPGSGMGIFALSAIIVDKAEPSEALKANTAWSFGLENPTRLLSSRQLALFRNKQKVCGESDVKGERGAYFLVSEVSLPAGAAKKWAIVANVNQGHSQIVSLAQSIKEDKDIGRRVQKDIDEGTKNLVRLVAGADGLQFTADKLSDNRHYANVLFNIMRGGVFDDNYRIRKKDFVQYLAKANKEVLAGNRGFIQALDDVFSQSALSSLVLKSDDADLIRLSFEYLPLKFSRRHGDPSRPWNYFTINFQNERDGSEILDYEGNWRDLFQNWEALAHAYPGFSEGMVFKFLNASTFDGYNPYRVTKDGFDWETLEPDNPWSYIGYWGDHQVIYLQKLFEVAEKFRPGALQSLFDKEWFVYAAVPYLIKPYDQILANPKDTIGFDHEWDARIRRQRGILGADGTLLGADGKEIYHVNFLEKILATVLAKMSNFIPEAGIWLNTQRPEWNDANNALVGNGASMVTLYYLHRFMAFFQEALEGCGLENVRVSGELAEFYHSIRETLRAFSPLLAGSIGDKDRKTIMDRLGRPASEYRQHIYKSGFWGKKRSISIAGIREFTSLCLDFIRHSIRANQRADKLYHAYNLITVTDSGVSFDHLDEMLEGQVAVLSSGYLSPEEALGVMDALKGSVLFREDQYSYILYPNKDLPGFLDKNTIPAEEAQASALIRKLLADGNTEIVEQDLLGAVHFNGDFRNAGDLGAALDELAGGQHGKEQNTGPGEGQGLEQDKQHEGAYRELVRKERRLLLEIFEKVFRHKAFTGRSGTFFAYEGLGSIYWHMVSKLLLAVQECCQKAIGEHADPVLVGKLLDHYYEVEAGIGVHKSPGLYGAFPTDPYSHTPQHRGAQQPGMTGQVKEDILSRFGELGVLVKDGRLGFIPGLLRKEEFLSEAGTFEYVTLHGIPAKLSLSKGQLAFTFCSVPILYTASDEEKIRVCYAGGKQEEVVGRELSQQVSRLIFNRTGKVERLEVSVKTQEKLL